MHYVQAFHMSVRVVADLRGIMGWSAHLYYNKVSTDFPVEEENNIF